MDSGPLKDALSAIASLANAMVAIVVVLIVAAFVLGICIGLR